MSAKTEMTLLTMMDDDVGLGDVPDYPIPVLKEYFLEELIKSFSNAVANRFPDLARELCHEQSAIRTCIEDNGLAQDQAAEFALEAIRKLPSYANLDTSDQIDVGVLFEVHVGQYVFGSKG